MRSLNLDIIVSPEVGFLILLFGTILSVYGSIQGKKKFDYDKFPVVNPVFKELVGYCLIIFGFIQILPFVFNYI